MLPKQPGGEGSTARELLRYPGVEQVVMVDIDAMVCNFCREHLEVGWLGVGRAQACTSWSEIHRSTTVGVHEIAFATPV